MTFKSKRTPEIEKTILEALSVGTTLVQVCRQVGLHPTTWNDWCAADAALGVAHRAARDKGADALAEQCLDIIDEQPPEITSEGGGTRIDSGHVAWQRARVDTRLKLLACWNPARYGNRTTTELTGANGGPVEVASPADVAAVAAAMRAAKQKETPHAATEPPAG